MSEVDTYTNKVVKKPIHRDRFTGTRKLKGRKFGKRAKICGTYYVWTNVNGRGKWVPA